MLLVAFTTILSVIFLLSGLLKAARPLQTQRTATALGAPRPLQSRIAAVALPYAEILLAAALWILPSPGRTLAACLLCVLLAVFTTLVVRTLREGREVSCGCFGALDQDTPVSRWTVVRNVVLFLMAGSIAVSGWSRPSTFDLIVQSSVATLLLTVLILSLLGNAILGILLAKNSLSSAEPTTAVLAPQMGDPVPEAELVDPHGLTLSLDRVGNLSPCFLLFLRAECHTCAETAARIPEWRKELESRGIIVRVATSSAPSDLEVRMPEVLPVALYGAESARAALGIRRSPSAVVIGQGINPIIASPIASGPMEIEALVRGLLEATEQPR